jgi:predicted transcriptional regulator
MADTPVQQTAKIVAAYVGNHNVAINDLPDLISSTYAALNGTSTPEPIQAERLPPAVPIKKSVTPDAVICLECGKPQSMLKRHIATSHELSVDEYRAKWGLASDYPMVAPNYAARRSELAIKIGLGRKPKSVTSPSDTGEVPEEIKPQHSYPASRWSKPAG